MLPNSVCETEPLFVLRTINPSCSFYIRLPHFKMLINLPFSLQPPLFLAENALPLRLTLPIAPSRISVRSFQEEILRHFWHQHLCSYRKIRTPRKAGRCNDTAAPHVHNTVLFLNERLFTVLGNDLRRLFPEDDGFPTRCACWCVCFIARSARCFLGRRPAHLLTRLSLMVFEIGEG